MSAVSGTPCRKAFTETLLSLAREDGRLIALTSDARGSVTLDEFAKTLPGQFVEVGIAEQDAVGIAAGLATTGRNVFVCGPACFLSARSLEQVKVDVAYSKTNVKIIGVSGGLSYGALGFSHHSLHDVAVMRTFPEMTVILPCDERQTRAMTRTLAGLKGPAYVRMGRNAVPDVYEAGDVPFVIGKANRLHEGTDATVIATGETVRPALDAAIALAAEGISVRVLDMHTLRPLDTEAVLDAARETGHLVTVEEHSVYGGLGGAVAELVSQKHPVPLRILGVPDDPVPAGNSKDVFRHFGLDADGIARSIRSLLGR